MTLGGAAAAKVRLIVWCKDCRHQVEPDFAEMAARYGAETPVLSWRERLVTTIVRPQRPNSPGEKEPLQRGPIRSQAKLG
jgi:hypothetical protein